MKIAMMFALGTLAMAGPALAGSVTINGDTTGEPTFNRPIGDGPPLFLSGVGTAVPHEATPFTVTAAGVYDFRFNADYDNYSGLYAGAFDPNDPLLNALYYNDDLAGIGFSGFDFVLSTGVAYFAVATGFENDDFGPYTLTISGPGDIILRDTPPPPVAEPASITGMALALGLLGTALRRKRP